MMMPPPTPVPRVTSTTLSWPTAAPATCSARAAQLASLLRRQGMPKRCSSIRHTGTWSHPRLYARSTTPSAELQVPGEPTPMLRQSATDAPARARTCSTAPPMSRTTSAAGRLAMVGTLTRDTMAWPSSTTPTAMFVPPRSIPIRYICSPSTVPFTPGPGPAAGPPAPQGPDP